MKATLDVVDLSALMPGARPIAQLYTASGTAVDRGAGHLERQALANSCCFATGARRSKISIFWAQFLRAA